MTDPRLALYVILFNLSRLVGPTPAAVIASGVAAAGVSGVFWMVHRLFCQKNK